MSENLKIKRVCLERMHGHQSAEVELFPGLNIIYGKNGTGKTTLLHTIVNLLEMDLERFLHIMFQRISITTYSGDTVSLVQHRGEHGDVRVAVSINNEEVGICTNEQSCPAKVTDALNKLFTKRPVYLPAYRSMLEGTARGGLRYSYRRGGPEFSEKEFDQIMKREHEFLTQKGKDNRSPLFHREQEQVEMIAFKTLTCRAWFGNFVPVVRYPSIAEVHDELENEIEIARYIVAAQDEKNISTVFRRVLEVILSEKQIEVEQDVGALIDRVKKAVTDLGPESGDVPAVYGQIAEFLSQRQYDDITSSDKIKGVLKIYDDALSTRAENKKEVYAGVDTFIQSVNKFLGGSKELGYEHKKIPRRVRGKAFVALPDGRQINFNMLSSGERHVLTLLFAATHMSPADGLVIIDEPELSLHVDWQRIILGEIGKQAKDRQIVACTHSPEVAAEHMDAYIELVNIPIAQAESPENVEQAELDLEE